MKKIGIFYGSSTGTCKSLAVQLGRELGVADNDIFSADKLTSDLISAYDILFLGTSTWGYGELQDDWYDAVKILKSADLKEKTVAIFGCGDSEAYCDTFCDGMGILYEELKNSGCTFIGNHVSTDGYNFCSSAAVIDNCFVGLALDDMNESEKTSGRISNWIADLKSTCNL